MKLSDFYNEVSRKTDTPGTEISVAVTKRVLSEAFSLLAQMEVSDFVETIEKGVSCAKRKKDK